MLLGVVVSDSSRGFPLTEPFAVYRNIKRAGAYGRKNIYSIVHLFDESVYDRHQS